MQKRNKMSEKLEIILREMEVTKLDLQPGQTLMVTIKHEDLDQFSLQHLRLGLKRAFPNNQVMVFGMGLEGDVKFAVVNEPIASEPNLGYCGDCGCGKKERVELSKKENV